MTEFICSLGEGLEEAARQARYEQLAALSRPQAGKLQVLHDHRFGRGDLSALNIEFPKRIHAQCLDVAEELRRALEKLADDWWSCEMLISPFHDDVDAVIVRARGDLTMIGIKNLMLGLAEGLDDLLKVLELRRFERDGPASPSAAWADEGCERLGTQPIRSWKLRCAVFDGPGAALAILRKMSLAVDSIASWIGENQHGIDELPKSAAPLVEVASAPPHVESLRSEPGADGAADLASSAVADFAKADPALAHMDDAAEFESTLAAPAPRNGERELVQLIKPPIVEEVEHILRRKPRMLASKGK